MPKEKRPMTYDPNVGVIRNFFIQVRLTWLLLRDWRVPLWVKSTFFASVVYVVSPLDLAPDAIPILGQLDDLGVLIIGMKLLQEMSPAEVVAENMETITGHSAWEVDPHKEKPKKAPKPAADDGQVIDGTYREAEEEQPPPEPPPASP